MDLFWTAEQQWQSADGSYVLVDCHNSFHWMQFLFIASSYVIGIMVLILMVYPRVATDR
jgi:hypothetical protein